MLQPGEKWVTGNLVLGGYSVVGIASHPVENRNTPSRLLLLIETGISSDDIDLLARHKLNLALLGKLYTTKSNIISSYSHFKTALSIFLVTDCQSKNV